MGSAGVFSVAIAIFFFGFFILSLKLLKNISTLWQLPQRSRDTDLTSSPHTLLGLGMAFLLKHF